MSAVVTPGNLGSEFDQGIQEANLITLRLGAGLTKNAGTGEISVTLASVTQVIDIYSDLLAKATVDTGQDVNDNDTINITAARLDTGWATASGGLGYTGDPDRVRIAAMVHQQDPGNAVARANPTLQVQRSNNAGGTWADISPESATGYIRDATGHGESSNTVSFVDHAPGTNPIYRLVSRQESAEGDPVTVVSGQLACEAVLVTPTTVVLSVTAV